MSVLRPTLAWPPMVDAVAMSDQDPLHGLIVRTAAGDQAAFSDLYDATSRRLFGLAVKVLRDRDAAEEATLDAFTQVWRDAASYDPGKGSVIGWMLTLVRSRSVDLLRSRMRHLSREESLASVIATPSAEPDPEAVSHETERTERVRAALDTLPDAQREAIEATYFGGLSHTEVAEATNLPLGTVKTRIRTGLTTLRRRLADARGGMT